MIRGAITPIEGIINHKMNYSLYFHIPFCKHRCHYCDFITTAGQQRHIPAYMTTLIKEFRIVMERIGSISVHSIYFGGGTPSLVEIPDYAQLFELLRSTFDLSLDCEISLEANPGTISASYLKELREIGFNRISLGVQSMKPEDLRRLDRIHSVEEVIQGVYLSKQAGFENINLDMIFGLPGQDLPGWEASLQQALNLKPTHFSLYSLIIEPGTPLHTWYQRGLIAPQDQDLEGDMYELAIETLQVEGFEHYEISNWAKRSDNFDYRCRHNLQYWLNQPYLGFGTGAHGYARGVRTENSADLFEYLHLIKQAQRYEAEFPCSPATINATPVDQATQMKDFMMLGLRLIQEGASAERFRRLYEMEMEDVFAVEIDLLIKRGLVAWENTDHARLCLTDRGIMVANQVFMEFV